MSSDSAGGMPYESAIGSDPFAESEGTNNRGKIVILAAVALVVLCASAAFLLILLSNP